MHMTTGLTAAEWIIMIILAVALLIFLIVGTVLAVKLIGLSGEVRKFLVKGQSVADKTEDVVENAGGVVKNVRDLTSVGGLIKSFVNRQEKKARQAEKAGRAEEAETHTESKKEK